LHTVDLSRNVVPKSLIDEIAQIIISDPDCKLRTIDLRHLKDIYKPDQKLDGGEESKSNSSGWDWSRFLSKF